MVSVNFETSKRNDLNLCRKTFHRVKIESKGSKDGFCKLVKA
jgi:hypothetical protein